MIKKTSIMILLSVFMLTGCPAMLKYNESVYDGKEYIPADVNEPHANVVMVGNGLGGYYFGTYLEEDTKRHEFPSKLQDIDITLPDDFKGKIFYSFYMKIQPHELSVVGFNSSIVAKKCSIPKKFTPLKDKNYLFYLYREDDKCFLKIKEFVKVNGQYQFINVNSEIK